MSGRRNTATTTDAAAGRCVADSDQGIEGCSRYSSSRSPATAPLTVSVELAHTTISTGDLVGLRVGDIITTEQDCHAPLLVNVEGIPKFRALPGLFKGRKAIQVDEVIEPEKEAK